MSLRKPPMPRRPFGAGCHAMARVLPVVSR